jgi:hypothetical protein
MVLELEEIYEGKTGLGYKLYTNFKPCSNQKCYAWYLNCELQFCENMKCLNDERYKQFKQKN